MKLNDTVIHAVHQMGPGIVRVPVRNEPCTIPEDPKTKEVTFIFTYQYNRTNGISLELVLLIRKHVKKTILTSCHAE